MNRIIQILTVFLLFSSCNSVTTGKEPLEKVPRHKRLLGFKTSFLAEMGDEKYDQLEKEKGKIETKFIDDIIYVSYYEELNACGQYDGNIEMRNDSIKLSVILISDEVCTSLSIHKVTFIIDNPDEKKKVVLK